MTDITIYCKKCKERKTAIKMEYLETGILVQMPCNHHVEIFHNFSIEEVS